MTHAKLISLLLAMLITTSYVAANLQIAGVYYDPVQAESGGEAIQLENRDSTPHTLDALQLATKTTSYDLPAVTLLPGQGYLIADTGWSTLRDNLSWPLADLEVGLSLANTEAWVELRENGSVLDHLGWNSSNGTKAREGYLFTHAGEATPFFQNSNSTIAEVEATVTVTDAPPTFVALRMTDDAPSAGIQLLSFDRVLTLAVTTADPNGDAVNISITFLGHTVDLAGNGTEASGTLVMDRQAPGNYPLVITMRAGNLTTTRAEQVTLLSSTSITTSGSLVFTGAPGASVQGSFTVTNEGNIPKTVTLQHSIPDATCDTSTVLLAPDEARTVTCTVVIPATAAQTFRYTVRLLAS